MNKMKMTVVIVQKESYMPIKSIDEFLNDRLRKRTKTLENWHSTLNDVCFRPCSSSLMFWGVEFTLLTGCPYKDVTICEILLFLPYDRLMNALTTLVAS